MFEAKLTKADLLKKVISAIKDLISDAPFDCAESGLALQAMDSSHVALVSLKLEAHGFETYRCDRSQSLGISLATLDKILKCCGGDDTCTVRYGDEGDTVTIILEDSKRDKQQECELKLMDLDTEHLGIPDQEYACKVTMPSNEFQKAIRDLSTFTDSITMIATKAGIQFQGKGDSGSHVIRWGQTASTDDDTEGVKIDLTEPVNITFAIKYMQHFVKATPLSGQVTLSLSSDVPIVVQYKIEDMGYLRFYLAPKIDDEEMPDH